MLPAHAGMILIADNSEGRLIDVTRTRGDDPIRGITIDIGGKCYPHTRG